MRRTDEAARTAANRRRRRTVPGLRGEKSRQVARDGRIRRVGQTKLLEPPEPPTCRHLVGADRREESIDEDRIEIGASKLSANRAADEPCALAKRRDRVGILAGIGEQRLLRDSALVPQGLQLPRVDAMAV